MAADGQLDPESGHVTLTEFDPVFRTFPVEERLRIGGGRPDLVLRAAYVSPETDYAAATHWGHGVMTRSWDANGHRTDYLHDRHGRLTAVVAPGDTAALPTVVHAYQPADPQRGLRYDYDRSGGLLPAGVAVAVRVDQAANAVVTDRREVSGQAAVFRSVAFTTGRGVEVLRLEEDRDGYAVVQAVRTGLRGTAVFEAQPYRQATAGFRIPGRDVVGTDLWRDPLDRVTRRRLPPETADPRSPRLETRVHHLPLAEWRFDEEDLAVADPALGDHRGTPLVLHRDGLDRLIAATEHADAGDGVEAWRTTYMYDLNDQLAGILDSQGNLRVMRHDGLGRRIALQDVNRGLLSFSFDAAGNVTGTRDAKGQRITYRYDGLNRLVSEDYHDAGRPFSSGRDLDASRPVTDDNRPDVLYTYDAPLGPVDLGDGRTVLPANTRGFLASVSDLSGEEHVSYDERGRVAWEAKLIGPTDGEASGYLTTMTYDASDRLTGIGYPDGTRVSYRYDARGRTRRIDSPQLGVVVADQTYTAAGLHTDITLGNGVRTSKSYDPRLRLETIETRPAQDEAPFLAYRYRYDGASNVLQIEDRRPEAVRARRFDNSQRFTYDDLYRLASAAYDTGRLSLAYDQIGNLTRREFAVANDAARPPSMPGTIRYGGSAGASGRIGRSGGDPGPQAPSSDESGGAYRYDANGNMVQHGQMTLTWDFRDRLVAVQSPASRVEYVYDYTGRRVVKRLWDGAARHSGPPTETRYVSRYFVLVDGAPQRYVFDGETRLARAQAGEDPVFYHQDLAASTDALSHASGGLIQSNAFLPFGTVRARFDAARAPGTAAAPEYLYHQKERDRETALLYFEARYLDAMSGALHERRSRDSGLASRRPAGAATAERLFVCGEQPATIHGPVR